MLSSASHAYFAGTPSEKAAVPKSEAPQQPSRTGQKAVVNSGAEQKKDVRQPSRSPKADNSKAKPPQVLELVKVDNSKTSKAAVPKKGERAGPGRNMAKSISSKKVEAAVSLARLAGSGTSNKKSGSRKKGSKQSLQQLAEVAAEAGEGEDAEVRCLP